MEKMLVVVNVHEPDYDSILFACNLAENANASLNALFIDNPVPEYISSIYSGRSFTQSIALYKEASISAELEYAVALFTHECAQHNIACEITLQVGDPMQQVIFESRFSDLLILAPNTDFYRSDESMPSYFMKEIICKTECPVLLACSKCPDVEEIVFCYDGTSASAFAIKQFTYLMRQFHSRKALLLEVKPSANEEMNESNSRMLEWLKSHYHSAYYHALKTEIKDELNAYFFMKRKKLIVMSAYAKNLLSDFLRSCNAKTMLHMNELPIFITHP